MAIERTINRLINGSPHDPGAESKAAIKPGAAAARSDKLRGARALSEILTSRRAHA
jgi:hypothetical protein